MTTPEKPIALPARLIASLNSTHADLLAIHKALLDHERIGYERDHGTIGSPGEFLQLVIADPWFAWLRTLSGLITQIDEFLTSKDPPRPGEGEALLAQSSVLLASSAATDAAIMRFQNEYRRALQDSPEVALAHGQWKLTAIQVARPT